MLSKAIGTTFALAAIFLTIFPIKIPTQETKTVVFKGEACYEISCEKPILPVVRAVFAAGKLAYNLQDERTLDPEKIFSLINSYREQKGLPKYEKDESLCELAKSREPELYAEIFEGKGIHSGLKRRHLPYRVTENMKYGQSEENVFNWWLSSPIHRRGVLSKHKYSCGTCHGKICIQLFSDFIPRPAS